MKLLYPAALALALLAVLLPVAVAKPAPSPPPAEVSASPSPEPSPSPTPRASLDGARTVMLVRNGAAEELPLDEYLTGVVAAEMPASFAPAALEAQCVAARTYARYAAARDVHGVGLCGASFPCAARA